MPTAFQILAAMITPAVLISACGTLVFSTSSRVSRVVERVRSVAAQIGRIGRDTSTSSIDAAARDFFIGDLRRLSRRAILLRSALTGFYVAISIFVATSIAVGLVAITDVGLSWVPVTLELAGSCVLLYGTILLISEARLGVSSTLKEMDMVSALIAAQETAGVLSHPGKGGRRRR